jgi:fructuronate reductase
LSSVTLAQSKTATAGCGWSRASLRPRIVHLGLGAFFRAHGVLYNDEMLDHRGGDWGIVGVSLQHPDARDRLVPQDGLYTAIRRDQSGDSARIARSLIGVCFSPENPAATTALLAAPETEIVSLTITEKGYCLDPASRRLDANHPDIRHDLASPSDPRSAAGILASALRQRYRQGRAPFTVLSCDNLPGNGALLRQSLIDFLSLGDDSLAQWLEANGAFPSTVVDRIVPATTPDDLRVAAHAVGLTDLAPVVHEPFRQWVIEDWFAAARPQWDTAGARFTGDVQLYEQMKLRLLNGAHSALAYLGYLVGHDTIFDAMSDPVMRAFTARLWDEILPTISAPADANSRQYVAELEARFLNPAIAHRTWQIAGDGSQKLPQRLLASVRARLTRQQPITHLAFVIGAWLLYLGGRREDGTTIDVRDPMAATLRSRLDRAGDDSEARVRTLVEIAAIFGSDLSTDRGFVASVVEAYGRLRLRGVRDAIAHAVQPALARE